VEKEVFPLSQKSSDDRIRKISQPGGLRFSPLGIFTMDELFLAGDIGGTKTRLALFSIKAGDCEPFEIESFPSQEYASLEDIVLHYMAGKPARLSGANFGIAGPIFGGRAQVTNLNWTVEESSLSDALGGIPVKLLNDLYAIASGIPYLKAKDLVTLIPGEPSRHGAKGVVAPGTGLGEGFLLWDRERYQPYPSEGGHTSFGPETPLQLELLNYLDPIFGHVSYERVCSGLGIGNLYKFLRDGKGFDEPAWLAELLAEVEDPTPIIAQAALENKAEICTQTMDLFVSILGSEAGNLALKVLATGGIYLGGGIPRRILPLLKGKAFVQGFLDKGRFADMLTKVPVYVITHPAAGVYGAACHELRQ
jgi:glucokinase